MSKKEVLSFGLKEQFDSEDDAINKGIEAAKKAIDYHEEHGEWPDWIKDGIHERQS